MKYKYSKRQIFGKKLEVPKTILLKVYNCTLTFEEFIEYKLDDKIPISCLKESNRKIVENIGIEKAKTLDWNIIEGKVFLEDIINKWELYKDKDLSYCLQNDIYNEFNITDSQLKEFMKEFKGISRLIFYNNNIYSVINDINNIKDQQEKQKYIKKITDNILEKTIKKEWYHKVLELSNEEYNELFKYSSIEEYLSKEDNQFYNDYISKILKELKKLPQDYIANMPIPFNNLKDNGIVFFISIYGLRNIVDFDNECGQFFTKNNSEMLKLMYDMYMHYAGNEHDSNKTIYLNTDNEIYSKDEFYEVMRRMIIYGPTNIKFANKAPDYREMTGEFRVRNSELFISEQAPEELKKIFYAKSITPEILLKHPEYVIYLKDKDLKNCFKVGDVKVNGSDTLNGYENFYKFISDKTDFNNTIKLITEYNEILEEFFYKDIENKLQYKIEFLKEDNIEEIQRKINETFKKLIIEKGIVYPRNIPQNFIENYPTMFLNSESPKELQEAFYNRTINESFILSNPTYKNYLKDIDLEILYKYMPIEITKEDGSYHTINLISFIKQTFGNEASFDIMLKYGKYIKTAFEINKLRRFSINENCSKDKLLDQIDNIVLETIIDKNMKYDVKIPKHFKNNNPTLFLDENVPQDIQDKFYNREFTLDDFIANPNLIEIFGNTNILYGLSKDVTAVIQLLNDFKEKTNNYRLEIASEYLKIQDEMIKSKFKQYAIYLSENVPQDMRDRFYKKEFTINDFISNPNLLEIFGDINILYGLSEDVYQMIPLFDNKDYSNEYRLKIASEYLKIQDYEMRQFFIQNIKEYGKSVDIEKIKYISDILTKISLSNSNEIFAVRRELVIQILNTTNPTETLDKIEDIFIKNKVPTIGKIYSCFEILHPNSISLQTINGSPILEKMSTIGKKAIIFSDLIKASFGSNNRTIKKFLEDIEIGNKLYENIKLGQIEYETLDETELKALNTFSKILSTTYNNMQNKNEVFKHTEDVISDISELSKKLSPNGKSDYNLGDTVIRMFAGIIGINSLEEAKEWINKRVKNTDERNRKTSNSEMKLEQGDFIKGIGDITYLRNILQNGSVAKEFLGASATSDATPLDTDVSKITKEDGTIKEKINNTVANNYGPIYFVLKNDERFITTRTNMENFNVKNDMSKMEVFYTGVLGEGHYGIRTGFSSSEINYIVMENYDEKVGFEIARNGFYIPVADMEGKIIFTSKDYDEMRKKMAGLSYYGENNYTFSENLVTNETEYLASQIDKNSKETEEKRIKIYKAIENSLNELGLKIKTTIDGDLTNGFVELIDTGSTGRNTNVANNSDFDFLMRLDKTILLNQNKTEELKQTILRNLGKIKSPNLTDAGDFRFKGVEIDTETNVDIDITFSQKTDEISYSTDMALKDRLDTIKKLNPKKYKYVVANIILAKQVLKKAEVYKSNHSEEPQGGLGGVGIENWVLQNGGSFIDAAKSFIEASEGKSFEEFKNYYYIWDFGENHLARRKGLYPYDNFVANNMSEEGYKKMTQLLKEYVKSYSKPVHSLGKESLEEQKNVRFLDEIEKDQERQLIEMVNETIYK